MTEASTTTGRSTEHYRVVEAALDALEQLAAAADVHVSRGAARRAMEIAPAADEGADLIDIWAHAVQSAARVVGLNVRAHPMSVRDVLAGGAGGLPLVALPLGDADLSPVLIFDVASRRCAVRHQDRDAWMTGERVAELLGAQSLDERLMLLVGEARAPMSA